MATLVDANTNQWFVSWIRMQKAKIAEICPKSVNLKFFLFKFDKKKNLFWKVTKNKHKILCVPCKLCFSFKPIFYFQDPDPHLDSHESWGIHITDTNSDIFHNSTFLQRIILYYIVYLIKKSIVEVDSRTRSVGCRGEALSESVALERF